VAGVPVVHGAERPANDEPVVESRDSLAPTGSFSRASEIPSEPVRVISSFALDEAVASRITVPMHMDHSETLSPAENGSSWRVRSTGIVD
jgi:hypothetical protein